MISNIEGLLECLSSDEAVEVSKDLFDKLSIIFNSEGVLYTVSFDPISIGTVFSDENMHEILIQQLDKYLLTSSGISHLRSVDMMDYDKIFSC